MRDDGSLRPGLSEPDAEGFVAWTPAGDDFNAIFRQIRFRVEDGKVRCRIETGQRHVNRMGTLHGGFLLAYVDQVFFISGSALGIFEVGQAVTLAQSSQFIAAGAPDRPLDALVEVVGETGRMLFLRGLMLQGDKILLSFEGTVRKLVPRAG